MARKSNRFEEVNWEDRLSKARSQLILEQPFFGVLALYLDVEEDSSPQNPTMSTDGTTLYVNPEFLLDLSDEHAVFVIAHEVMHNALEHHFRMGTRDLPTWNKAADYVVNSELIKAGFKMPPCGLYDAHFDGMSSEEVYAILEKEQQKQQGSQPQQQNGKNKEDNPDPGKLGGIRKPQGDEAEQARQQSENRVRVQQAAATAKAQNAGKLPGTIERILQISKPQADWRTLMRQFVDDNAAQDYSWTNPNRRFLEEDFILPGTVPHGISHMVVAIDTSGSINEKQLSAFMAEVEAITSDMAIARTSVLYADADVKRVDEFEIGDTIKPNPVGGGGTDFRPVFNWVKTQAPTASLVLYFTDLDTSYFGDDPGRPTLWLVWGSNAEFERHSKRAPFGTAIHMAT